MKSCSASARTAGSQQRADRGPQPATGHQREALDALGNCQKKTLTIPWISTTGGPEPAMRQTT